jgi:spore coat polysaccharide biosynthesis protein SpsF
LLVYNTRIAVFIPIRLGSSRLPKKPLIEIKGKSLIEHLIERVKTAKLPNQIVLCTTTKPEDSVFIDIARKCNVKCFRGSEKDILD